MARAGFANSNVFCVMFALGMLALAGSLDLQADSRVGAASVYGADPVRNSNGQMAVVCVSTAGFQCSFFCVTGTSVLYFAVGVPSASGSVGCGNGSNPGDACDGLSPECAGWFWTGCNDGEPGVDTCDGYCVGYDITVMTCIVTLGIPE